MDLELSMDDLPVECVEEILKKITEKVNRNTARLVCKFWDSLMNGVSFSESCYVDLNHVEQTDIHEVTRTENFKIYIDFQRIFPIFLGFKRRISSFYFENVDFIHTHIDQRFWNQKGADIKSLYFRDECSNIPFNEIYEKCHQLKSLTIKYHFNIYDFTRSLKIGVNEQKVYPRLRHLHLKGVPETDIVETARLVKQVFPQISDLHFEKLECRLKLPENFVSSYAADLKQLQIKKISLSAFGGKYEIIMEHSNGNEQTVKANKLIIWINGDDFVEDDFSFNLLDYQYNFHPLQEFHFTVDDVPQSYCKLDQVDELISSCPSLKLLSIKVSFLDYVNSENIILTRPLRRNNIQFLDLQNWYYSAKLRAVINDVFIQSFNNLKSLKCQYLLYSDFVKILRHLEHLDVLSVTSGKLDKNHKEAVLISHGRLIKLKLPNKFLFQTAASYGFENLMKLSTSDPLYNGIEKFEINLSNLDIDCLLERMNCPNITKLTMNLAKQIKTNRNQEKSVLFTSKILSHFPILNELRLYLGVGIFRPEYQEKMEIIKNAHPILQNFTVI